MHEAISQNDLKSWLAQTPQNFKMKTNKTRTTTLRLSTFAVKIIFALLFLQSPALCLAKSLYDTAIHPAAAMPEKYIPQLKGLKVALVINQTSKVGSISLLDIMLNNGVSVKKIFVPEHGFRGNADAGAHIDNTLDSATGLPVISLYGSHKKPQAEDLGGIDIVVYDLQDVGVRFYTYISTLQYVMEACAQNDVKLLILDRPNPNGFYIDGPVLDTSTRSFVGMQPIPVVYGMTAGEYAKMLQGEGWVAGVHHLDLKVIPCTGYDHSKKYELPIPPSPNLRTMAAVYAYPSLCLFEGTVVSVGRGTSMPFQQYGSPDLNKTIFPHTFTPQSGPGAKSPPYDGKVCYGEIVGTDAPEVLRKINNSICLTWLLKSYSNSPASDKFFTPFFMKLSGTSVLEKQIETGTKETEIRASWLAGLQAFKKIRRRYLLYNDFE